MIRNKIKDLSELGIIADRYKKNGKTVGLVTGCFDILHIGHVELFQSAKKQVDVLIVGVECDETIRISKGENRPINGQDHRLRLLQALHYVDYVFPVIGAFDYTNDEDATIVHDAILQTISPHYLITTKNADKFWKEKEKRAEKFGIQLIDVTFEELISTTKIVEHLLSEL